MRMMRYLLAPLAASLLSIGPANTVRFADNFMLPNGSTVRMACLEERADSAVAFADIGDRISFYRDGDASGGIDGPSDRVVDVTAMNTTFYYPDARMDWDTKIVHGPIYRDGVAHIPSEEDWSAHLEAIGRFKQADPTYRTLVDHLSEREPVERATCDPTGFFGR